MILGIGSDIVNIERIEKLLTQFGERFEKKIFTTKEIDYANKRGKAGQRIKASTLAKRFAAKEAFVKAIGTGFNNGVLWREIEVENHAIGKPFITATGRALAQLRQLSPRGVLPRVDVSLSDDYPFAQAFIVISLG